MDAPTKEESKVNVAGEEGKDNTADASATLAGSKRDAAASSEEPPTKKATTASSSKAKGPPLIPMDFSDPDAKKPEVKEPKATPAPANAAAAAAASATATASSAASSAPKTDTSTVPSPSPDTAPAAAPKIALSSPTAPVSSPVPPARTPPKASAKATASTKRRPSTTGTAAAATATSSPLQSKNSSTSRGSGSKKSKDEGAANKMKGLRHFSMMVCKKVEEKGKTTYNEVADELVKKVIEERRKEDPTGKFDEKNIRRRVYDSINVLLAMDIIAKDKKQISWRGLPSSTQHDLQILEQEEQYRKGQVQIKRRALQQILTQQICFRNLVAHNKEREDLHAEKVPLPFIVVNSHKEAVIHCNMAPDLNDVMFEFDRPFEINDDNSILMRLGMHKTSLSTVEEMVPKDMVTYCQEHGLLDAVLGGSDPSSTPVLQSVGSNKGKYFMSLE